jgi:hypothetical protein
MSLRKSYVYKLGALQHVNRSTRLNTSIESLACSPWREGYAPVNPLEIFISDAVSKDRVAPAIVQLYEEKPTEWLVYYRESTTQTWIRIARPTWSKGFYYRLEPSVLNPHHKDSRVPNDKNTYDSGGEKESAGKPPVALVPAELMLGAARAFAFGEKKYSAHNWRKGVPACEYYSALQRHLLAWIEGESQDRESGYSHMDHAAACLAMLMQTLKDRPDLDNRHKKAMDHV